MKFLSKLFLVVLAVASMTLAQTGTTYYVNVSTGLDGYNGLSPVVTGEPGVGPKQTINDAIKASSDGATISVDYANGNLYNENVGSVAADHDDKSLTFISTGGTPNVYSWEFDLDSTPMGVGNDFVTFAGPFKITTLTTLTDGTVKGASYLTVKTALIRTNGAVDSQLDYDGEVAFTYNSGAGVTAGFELPDSENTTHFGDLTTSAGTVLKLNESKTMNGVLVTGAVLNLNSFTLTIVGTTPTGATLLDHTLGGNVTTGTLAMDLTGGDAQIDGAFTIDDLTVTDDGTARTFILLAATATGDVTANSKSNTTLTVATTLGDLTNNSTGTMTTVGTTINSITNTSSGKVDVNSAAPTTVTTNVVNTGVGNIDFVGVAGALGINGNVENSPTIDIDVADKVEANLYGVIVFPAQNVDIDGSLTVNTELSGTNSAARDHDGIGEVWFTGTTQTVDIGSLIVNATHSMTKGTLGLDVQASAGVVFDQTEGDITIGDVTVSSALAGITGATFTGNGGIDMSARDLNGDGVTGSKITMDDVLISSTGVNGANGNINLVPADPVLPADVDDKLAFGSITSTGAAGGYFLLGNEPYAVAGSVVNQRTSAATHIKLGAAPTAGISVSVGGTVELSGSSTTEFTSFDGGAAETFAVSGTVLITGTGAVQVAATADLGGTGAFTFGKIEISSGTLDLVGNAPGAGVALMEVVINGTASFYGGAIDIRGGAAITADLTDDATVAIGAGERYLQLGGLQNNFSTATTMTDFDATNCILLVQPTLVQATQTITGAALTSVWPTQVLVANTTGLQPAVVFNGGNFRVLGDLAFASSQVKLDGVYIFVGGQLAPNNGNGDFWNHSGYTTEGVAFVSMNGDAAANYGGRGDFGNFEVDCAAAVDVNPIVDADGVDPGIFTGTFNLTNGTVDITGNAPVEFDNTTNYPTIVRNAGIFDAAPTFTSMVNVYYIGIDKATANELPNTTNRLNDLTVATTNSVSWAGHGRVSCGVATTVNGTLKIFANQALLITGVDLTMAGDEIILDGVLANNAAADELILANPTGTTITGANWLPDIQVASGSAGNVIDGAKGLVTQFLGANTVWDPLTVVSDFNPTTTEASGSLIMAAGTTNDITLNFGGGALNSTQLTDITTNDADNTVNVGTALFQAGDVDHNAGVINIAEDLTWTHRGGDPEITSGALINGAGLLKFIDGDGAGDIDLTLVTDDVTIDCPVEIDLTLHTDLFTIDGGAGLDLILTNDFTFTEGRFVLGTNLVAQDLILQGENFYMDNESFFSHYLDDPDASGTGTVNDYVDGTLRLNPATAMTWEYEGTPTLGNVEIDGDVTLAGDNGVALVVYRDFTHTSGLLDFSDRDITIDGVTADVDAAGVPGSLQFGTMAAPTLPALGTYTNVAGTYAATDGWLVLRTATVNQGDNDFTIPNLRFGNDAGTDGDAVTPVFGDDGTITVLSNLFLDIDAATDEVTTNELFAVDSNAVVSYNNGAFDEVPNYIGTIQLVTVLEANRTIDATVWPATPDNLVSSLTLNHTALGIDLLLPGDRNVGDLLDLRVGTLDLGTGTDRTMTILNSTVRRRQGGAVDLTAGGTLTYVNPPDVYYEPSAAAAPGNFTSGSELPATVNDFFITRTGTPAPGNAVLTVNQAVTVNGTLTIDNTLNTAVPGTISLLGDVVITSDGATGFAAPVQFVGPTGDQLITVPAAGGAFGDMIINKADGNVLLEGGNLASGDITFTDGLFILGDNVLTLVVTPGNPFQAFNHDITVGNKSHVVGSVAIDPKMAPTEAWANTTWPVGSMTHYRPATITIMDVTAGGANLGADIIISHVDEKPAGIVNLPIPHEYNGEMQQIARYPDFYWNIAAEANLTNLEFDLELKAAGFTQYGNIAETVILRRQGSIEDTENEWSLQGTEYDNFVASGDPVVVNENSKGGLRPEGAIFTYGMPTRMFLNGTLANLTGANAIGEGTLSIDIEDLFGGNEGELTYHVSSTNPGVVSVTEDDFTETTFDINALTDGTATITVRATDINGDFITTSFNVEVDAAVALEEDLGIPTEFQLAQNFPNPFNPTTKIRFGLPEASSVVLKVYNILGEEVAKLVNQELQAGFHTFNFDASNLSSGLYIYRIEAGNFVEVKKMMLMK